MEADGLGDWRIRAATRLAADMPATASGAPAHKAGAPVLLSSAMKDPSGRPFGFITPSFSALALSIAMKAEARAKELFSALKLHETVSPWGSGPSVHQESTGVLFDYFEQCMIVTTFSFQALESYCNLIISEKMTSTFPLERGKSKKVVRMTATDLERNASTGEKLTTVLPQLLEVASPEGTLLWDGFEALKETRNATIHMKSQDQYSRAQPGQDLDQVSLFYRFIFEDVSALPKAAVSMIHYFAHSPEVPRWLKYPMEIYGIGERTRAPGLG